MSAPYLYSPIYLDRPTRTPAERRARAVETLITLWTDVQDDRPLRVLRDTLRPDLTLADVTEAAEGICDLSSERAETENDGPVEEYEALSAEYLAALTRLATRPALDQMALVDAAFGRPLIDAPLPDELAQRRQR
jgi:hypothetical protein